MALHHYDDPGLDFTPRNSGPGLLRRFTHNVLGWCDGKGAPIESDGLSFVSWCSVCGRRVLQDSQGGWFPSAIQFPPPGPAWEAPPEQDYTGMSFMQASSIAPEGKMTPLHQAFYANVKSAEAPPQEVLESLWKKSDD